MKSYGASFDLVKQNIFVQHNGDNVLITSLILAILSCANAFQHFSKHL